MQLRPVDRQSVSDAVYEQLAAAILDGSVAPGDALPGERTLTGQLGVNRQAVREALARLEQAGLVRIQHGGATTVADYRRQSGLELLPRLVVRPDGSVDRAAIRSILELRDAIGVDIARRCAARAVPALVDELDAVVEAMVDAARDADEPALASLVDLDHRFWDLLVDGADNIAYRLAYNSLWASYEPLSPVLRPVLEAELRDLTDRRAVVRAVRAGDERRAAAAARRLLARGTAAFAKVLSG